MLATVLNETAPLGLSEEYVLKFLFLGGGMLIALVAVIFSFTRSILVARAREQSRREIAAYVAEGSMTPEDGAKLLEAGRPAWEQGKGKSGGCC